jgi:hypothetical protein
LDAIVNQIVFATSAITIVKILARFTAKIVVPRMVARAIVLALVLKHVNMVAQ